MYIRELQWFIKQRIWKFRKIFRIRNIRNLQEKIRSIVKGYYTLFFLKKEPYIEYRQKQCLICDNNSLNKYKSLGYCKICKCVLKAKTASKEEQCPMDFPKWTRIELNTISKKMLSLEIHDEKVKTTKYGSDFGFEVNSKENLNLQFLLKCDSRYELDFDEIDYCSCMNVETYQLDKNIWEIIITSSDAILHKEVTFNYILIREDGEELPRKSVIKILKFNK